MVTYEDCLALVELTPEEVDLIAAHEHVPPIVALELGNYLSGTAGGARRVRRILGEQRAQAAADAGGKPLSDPAAAPARLPESGTRRLAA